MATPIENNTEGLQEILQMVNELPQSVNPDDFVLKSELPEAVSEIVQEELKNIDIPSQERITITLSSSGWSNNQQFVTATGVTADNDVFVSPAPGSYDAYCKAGILCETQTNNRLTFKCLKKPTSNLTVYVKIFG